MPPAIADPLHTAVTQSACAWTTVNVGEAFAGVPTPMTWSFYGDGIELGFHGAFHDIGVLPASAVRIADAPDDRVCAIFFGRGVINVDRMRHFADLMPGTSGDVMEKQLFGRVRPGLPVARPNPLRYPLVATKLPVAALRLTGQLDRDASDMHAWWQRSVRTGALTGKDAAAAILREAVARCSAIYRPQVLSMLLGQGLFERIVELCESAGRPELVNDLVGGDLVELEMLRDLWDVSRGARTLEAFVAEHGYHGPDEGEMLNRTWREDPAPLRALVATYAGMPESDGPVALHRRRRERRVEAEAALLGALGRTERALARVVLPLARKIVPYREVSKGAFLRTLDAGRAAVRVLGADLAERELVSDPDDAFMLTTAELLAGPTRSLHKTVTYRVERRAHHAAHELPEFSQGVPIPVVAATGVAGDGPVTGDPVAPGTARGRARIVLDPAVSELEPGDILVCRTTDPSWITLFLVAAAVVIDMGGPMSHGAIVARELGIPCVINTGDGTRRIPDGSIITVDGDAGHVRPEP